MASLSNPRSLVAALIACACLSPLAAPCRAAEEEDEDPTRPGLVMTRLDQDLASEAVATAMVAGDRSPRKWTGTIRIHEAGVHQFRAVLAGQVEIRVGGQVVLSETAVRQRLIEGPSVDLRDDDLSIEIVWRPPPINAAPRLWIGWAGPTFDWEPLPPQLLSHPVQDHPDFDGERGREWFRARRCDACHRVAANEVPALSLPGLDRGHERWRPTWLAKFVSDKTASTLHPKLAFGEKELDLAAAALWNRKPLDESKPKSTDAKVLALGEKLVHASGCLACHKLGDQGAGDSLSGGDLTAIAAKRPASFFEKWLADPASIDPRHRMPVFALEKDERAAIVAFLSTLGAGDDASRAADAELVERWATIDVNAGRRLLRERACDTCHAGGMLAASPKLDPTSRLDRGCLGDDKSSVTGRPTFVADDEERERFARFLRSGRPRGDDVRLVETGCLRCHSRQSTLVGDGPAEGLARTALSVYGKRPDWAPHPASLTPPTLTGVGDKLTDAALAEALAGKAPRMRSHMAVRMPRFNLGEADRAAIVKSLVDVDRAPEWSTKFAAKATPTKALDKTELDHAGRLVSADGFNCLACHAIGKTPAPQAPASAVGPNLADLAKRIRRPWFDRWVRDPARIVPRMEMPAVKRPIAGVFAGDLDVQLDAVWQALNQPGFTPPEPNPVRVARRSADGKSPWTLADLLYVPGDGQPALVQRPLLVVLPNGHNALLDRETGDLVAWTVGDAARQRSRGKVWHWELAGLPIVAFAPSDDSAENKTTIDGKPVRWRLTNWRLEGDSVVVEWLERRDDDNRPRAKLVQRIAPWSNGADSGFVRTVALSSLAAREAGFEFAARGQGSRVSQDPPADVVGDGGVEEGGFQGTWTYSTSAAAPPPSATPPATLASRDALNLAPGWTAERAPISTVPMPTGLAWWSERSALVTSLRGEVVEAFDRDDDGLPDETRVLADGLPAPYGLNVATDVNGRRWIDVAVKGALVRLELAAEESGRPGTALGHHILADGWGYSADYHDWTVGLTRDVRGDYLIGLPCQQDDRPPEQARLRGTVARVVRPEHGDRGLESLPWKVEPLTRGHRFPMGIAIDRAGHAMVTDNQGNYTPFNELNHIVAGRHFGFINKRDLGQPTGDIAPPAIAIPHPWVRSVNGLTTLDAPDDADGAKSRAAFGPLAGHFVGCEYTTRRLVRMTIEEIDGVVQGAVYPLTREPRTGEGPLGPLVASVSPRGDLFVGSLSEGGWAAAINAGELVRMRFDPRTAPPGIAAIESTADGFLVRLTKPIDDAWLTDATSFRVESYRRKATPAYGGDDEARRTESIAGVEKTSAGDAVRIRLAEPPRIGFVHELKIQPPAGSEFFPAEAWHTRNASPKP